MELALTVVADVVGVGILTPALAATSRGIVGDSGISWVIANIIGDLLRMLFCRVYKHADAATGGLDESL